MTRPIVAGRAEQSLNTAQASPVMGITEGMDGMGHWCHTQTMNHEMLHQKIRMYCVVTNIT